MCTTHIVHSLAAPSSPPTNIAVANASSDSFLLSWDAPPVEDSNGVIRNYMIRVTEVESARTFYIITNTTLLELNELHPFYKYMSAIAAQTVSLGPYSSAISVRLAEEGRRTQLYVEVNADNLPFFFLFCSTNFGSNQYFWRGG